MIPPPTGIKIYVNEAKNLTISEIIKDEFTTINFPCEIIKNNDKNEALVIQVNSK